MITILHGDDTAASRDAYWNLKQKSLENITLDGATISQTDLQQALSGDDLFRNAKDIFIENLFSKRKPSKELDALASLIAQSKGAITLWESKLLTPKQIGNFEKATSREFKIPSSIFALLDALRPGNGKQLITLFHTTLESKDAEFVLVMLTRQVRILLNISTMNDEPSTTNAISEISRLAPWQKGKLVKQASLFTTKHLLALHSKMFELELGMKTGGLSQPIADEIDFLLFSI